MVPSTKVVAARRATLSDNRLREKFRCLSQVARYRFAALRGKQRLVGQRPRGCVSGVLWRSVIVGDPTTYWSAPLTPGACAAMVAKYDALAAIEAMSAGGRRDRMIQRAARRWPASLRESQLAGPQVCLQRRRAALEGAQGPARSRAGWCSRAPALPLWSSLHLLIGDLVGWRRQLSRGAETSPAALLDHLGRAPQSARWQAELLAEIVGPRVQVRLAYLWLAACCGLPPTVLSAVLFARKGLWARREDDPPDSDSTALPIEIAGFFPVQSESRGIS